MFCATPSPGMHESHDDPLELGINLTSKPHTDAHREGFRPIFKGQPQRERERETESSRGHRMSACLLSLLKAVLHVCSSAVQQSFAVLILQPCVAASKLNIALTIRRNAALVSCSMTPL